MDNKKKIIFEKFMEYKNILDILKEYHKSFNRQINEDITMFTKTVYKILYYKYIDHCNNATTKQIKNITNKSKNNKESVNFYKDTTKNIEFIKKKHIYNLLINVYIYLLDHKKPIIVELFDKLKTITKYEEFIPPDLITKINSVITSYTPPDRLEQQHQPTPANHSTEKTEYKDLIEYIGTLTLYKEDGYDDKIHIDELKRLELIIPRELGGGK